MADYRVNIGTGNYRHFIVEADSQEQARKRFDKVSKQWPCPTCGFTLKDITSVTLIKEKV